MDLIPLTVHFKMVKMVNFTLCVFYQLKFLNLIVGIWEPRTVFIFKLYMHKLRKMYKITKYTIILSREGREIKPRPFDMPTITPSFMSPVSFVIIHPELPQQHI